VPSSEDPSLLGIIYDSVSFPQHNGTGPASVRLTVSGRGRAGDGDDPGAHGADRADPGGLTVLLVPYR